MSNRLTPAELADLSNVTRNMYLGMHEDDQIAFAKKMRGGADGPPVTSTTETPVQVAPRSLMRDVGLWGFWLSLIALVVGIVLALSGAVLGVIVFAIGSSVGLFAFMWMLGAIEMRLIQINDTLKSQAKANA